MTTRLASFCAAAVSSVALVIACGPLPAWGQQAPSVRVEPNSGAPGVTFKITMDNYKACPANSPNCIIIDFVQGPTTTRIGTADSRQATSFSGEVKVPPGASAGPAEVRAHSATDDAKATFTVVAPSSTTTTSSTTTSTTRVSTTTTSSTSTTSTTVAPTTTTTLKKDESHSDTPRYIAVALVVAAAIATAVVDTRLRRVRG